MRDGKPVAMYLSTIISPTTRMASSKRTSKSVLLLQVNRDKQRSAPPERTLTMRDREAALLPRPGQGDGSARWRVPFLQFGEHESSLQRLHDVDEAVSCCICFRVPHDSRSIAEMLKYQ